MSCDEMVQEADAYIESMQLDMSIDVQDVSKEQKAMMAILYDMAHNKVKV